MEMRVLGRTGASVSKFCLPMDDDPNHRGNSRRWIFREVEQSLQQAPYSLFARRVEGDVLPTCQRYGIGVVV